MKELNFNDRISYLAWRSEWRACYNTLTRDIRLLKQAFKNEQRKVTVTFVDKYGGYYEAKYEGDKSLDWLHAKDYYKSLEFLIRARQEARDMMEIRAKATEKRDRIRDLQLAAA